MLERRVEHALARHHLAVVDVLRRAVRDDRDVVAVLDEAERELEAGLAGADWAVDGGYSAMGPEQAEPAIPKLME
jgi:hypothetical protein